MQKGTGSVRKVCSLFVLLSTVTHFALAQGIGDVAPSGRPNERAILGGSRAVVIDTNTPLPVLIERLTGKWELVPTLKLYWIGYTGDMYSIASHREQAIGPLVNLIRTNSSEHAREGALLTLHLIGIESRVVGRFHEEFKSKTVRAAFYDFLEDPGLRDKVLLLLVRDPWPSDVPHIMKILAREGDTDCRQTVNALFRYSLPCPAFGGSLQENASSARVFVVQGKHKTEIGSMFVFAEEKPNEGGERINAVDTNIVIQWRTGGARKAWMFNDLELARRTFAPYLQDRDICNVTYDALLKNSDFVFRYCYLDDPFNFQVSGTNVYIIDPPAAKTRWLEWWKRQSDDYKNALQSAEHSAGFTGDSGPRLIW